MSYNPFSLHKAQAAGNDFIILSENSALPTALQCKSLCCRRRSLGADGLIHFALHVTNKTPPLVLMRFFNADGSEVGMCGNALRALTMHIARFCPHAGADRGVAITLNQDVFQKAQTNPSLYTQYQESDFVFCEVVKQTTSELDPSFAHPFGEKTYWVQSVFPLAKKIPFTKEKEQVQSLVQAHLQRKKLLVDVCIECADSGVEHLFIQLIPSKSQKVDLHALDLETLSSQIKNDSLVTKALPAGMNLSFITWDEENGASSLSHRIRTFERGVYEETWSCTSALVAAATFMGEEGQKMSFVFSLKQQSLEITRKGERLYLLGPAQTSYFTDQNFASPCASRNRSDNIFANKGKS